MFTFINTYARPTYYTNPYIYIYIHDATLQLHQVHLQGAPRQGARPGVPVRGRVRRALPQPHPPHRVRSYALFLPCPSFCVYVHATSKRLCLTYHKHPSPPPIRCIGGGNGKGGDEEEEGGGGNGKKEKYHNCNAGPGCGNRQFRNKEYIKHQVRLQTLCACMPMDC
jgi:hypothetical protein